jgi:hypothetical protein
MKSKTVLSTLSNAIVARANCAKSGNTEYYAKWDALIEQIAENCLPSGSGFDCGTKVDLTENRGVCASNGQLKIVLTTSFHHMDENGYYDGWTEHKITVKPCLLFGFSLTISGRDRNGIKEYMHETFSHALEQECAETLASV